MSQYQAAPPPAAASYPGKTLGIVGLILAIIPCTWWAGLVISIIAFVQSRKVGVRNSLALAGIIIGALWLVFVIIAYATGLTTQYLPR
jgi:hypothetical protein